MTIEIHQAFARHYLCLAWNKPVVIHVFSLIPSDQSLSSHTLYLCETSTYQSWRGVTRLACLNPYGVLLRFGDGSRVILLHRDGSESRQSSLFARIADAECCHVTWVSMWSFLTFWRPCLFGCAAQIKAPYWILALQIRSKVSPDRERFLSKFFIFDLRLFNLFILASLDALARTNFVKLWRLRMAHTAHIVRRWDTGQRV